MKINIMYKIILLMLLIVTSTSSVCFAAPQHIQQEIYDGGGNPVDSSEDGSSGSGNSQYLPNLDDEGYKPAPENSGKAKKVISNILGALTTVGAIIAVLAISIIGYNTIIGTASDKAFEKEKLIGVAIGAAIMTGSSALAQMIVSIAETF